MTHEELLERMSYEELIRWRVLEEIEPFGDRRLDILNGILCSLIANIHRSQNTQRLKPTDFMIDVHEEEQQPQDMMAFMKAFMAASNQRKPN